MEKNEKGSKLTVSVNPFYTVESINANFLGSKETHVFCRKSKKRIFREAYGEMGEKILHY